MDEKTRISPNELLVEYINHYLGANGSNQDELEVRFGTKYYNTITKIHFENIIAKIKSLGFRAHISEGESYLNIQNEYADPKSGKMKLSNIRTTINGVHNIQKYCKENNLIADNLPIGTEFLQKFSKRNNDNNLRPIDFHDFHFRVNYIFKS